MFPSSQFIIKKLLTIIKNFFFGTIYIFALIIELIYIRISEKLRKK